MEELIVKFINKSITKQELDDLSSWLEDTNNHKQFTKYVKLNYAIDYNISNFNDEIANIRLLDSIEKSKKKAKKLKLKYYKYAAAILLISLSSGYFFFSGKNVTSQIKSLDAVTIAPGVTKAILTLSNGEQIKLDEKEKLVSKVATTNGEHIVYQESNKKNNEGKETITNVKYNYLTIPRGAQYKAKLSDGTIVWLNSESKLKYPEKFLDNASREVELVYGEAYFDVSHSSENNGQPFKVHTSTQEVEVLGTEFNVRAYLNAPKVYTTLVNGKVNIGNDVFTKTLNPGFQSIVNIDTEDIQVVEAQVESEISWIHGYLVNDNPLPLEKILEKVSRWYNIDVKFENEEARLIQFVAKLNYEDNLNKLLENFEGTGEVEFKVKGNELIIYKK